MCVYICLYPDIKIYPPQSLWVHTESETRTYMKLHKKNREHKLTVFYIHRLMHIRYAQIYFISTSLIQGHIYTMSHIAFLYGQMRCSVPKVSKRFAAGEEKEASALHPCAFIWILNDVHRITCTVFIFLFCYKRHAHSFDYNYIIVLFILYKINHMLNVGYPFQDHMF